MASASKSQSFLFSNFLLFITLLSSKYFIAAEEQNPPHAFYIPFSKDSKTLQYLATIAIGTPPATVDAVIDLGGQFLSLACDKYNSSTTRRSVPCDSMECKKVQGHAKGKKRCGSNDTCSLLPFNPFNENAVADAELSDDIVTVDGTDGTGWFSIPVYSTHLVYSCVDPNSLFKGLAKGVDGILGLGRKTPQTSLPTRLTSAYNLPQKFALCLPSSSGNGLGDLFVGGGPYWYPGGNDASKWLVYTPLAQSSEGEYFVSVKAIKIDRRVVHNFDASLLAINQKGFGGTKISTATPYGVLHSSIYKAVVGDFVKRAAARNITSVTPVAPFGACFSTKNLHWTKAGPRVPVIDLVLPGNMGSLNWRIEGANSMVRVNKYVLCLGFVDGGSKAKASIILGGHQLGDNFLEFDLTRTMLGYTSSLLPRGVTCSNYRNL